MSTDVSEEHIASFLEFGSCAMVVSFLAYSSILLMHALCFSETSVDFDRTTRCYTLEDTAVRTSNLTHPTVGLCEGCGYAVCDFVMREADTSKLTEVRRDSSVGIVTGLQAGQPRKWCSIPGRSKKLFSFRQLTDWLWGPTRLLYNGYRRLFTHG
jgi:hypothetical protein